MVNPLTCSRNEHLEIVSNVYFLGLHVLIEGRLLVLFELQQDLANLVCVTLLHHLSHGGEAKLLLRLAERFYLEKLAVSGE